MEAKDLQNPVHEDKSRTELDVEKLESQNSETTEKDENATPDNLKDELSQSREEETHTPTQDQVKDEVPNAPEQTEAVVDSKAEVKDKNPKEHHMLDVDVESMNSRELMNKLSELLDSQPVNKIKGVVEAIKTEFYKKYKIDVANALKVFVDEGGNEADFEYNDDVEVQLKALLKRFRDKKSDFNRNMEQEKEANLKVKYQIIEEIKELINRKESINKTFQEFQDLQAKWREVGMVPQQAVKGLWDTYHHHVENFYDYIKINKELRDLDLKKNLESKIKLCELAEELLLEPSIVKAFKTLQKHHEQWREIGPVPREQKDELWARFKEVTTEINRKHQEFYEGLKMDQRKNLDAKTLLCDKAEEVANRVIGSHKEWNISSKEILELQKVWRTIGFAPKKDNQRIYQRFRAACDLYFNRKRDFYLHLKDELNVNLQQKIDLCVKAEALQNSQEWKKTTDELIAIQRHWKEIGPVPRKVSDELWVRFRAACDRFFNQKSAHFESKDTAQLDNLKLKEELIQRVKDYQSVKDNDKNLEQIRAFQKEWSEIGHVPYKHKDHVQEEFRKAINQHFDRMDLDSHHKEVQRFKNKVEGYVEMKHSDDKLIGERNKIANKIKQLEGDITLWENNIGFFSSSKNADAMIRDIQKKIDNGKKNLALLKEKLDIIDDID